VEYLWHKEDTGNGLTWQLKRCRVAPGFPAEQQPAGLLVHKLTLQQLEDVKDHVGLRHFMLWANNEQTNAPQGFRWLTQYSEKLAERHALPVTPVGLRLSGGGQPLLSLGDAISNEGHIHAMVGQSDCQYLRKAVQGFYGQVEGAGSGLSFIGLEHFCHGSIQPHHLVSDEAKTKYINQAGAQ